jgi:hypothetical protein
MPLVRLLLLASALLIACPLACRPSGPISVAYSKLDWQNDLFLLEGQPFSGLALDQHPNGQPKASYPLRNGRLHGLVQEWWENGQPCTETHFENGKRHGLNTYWDRSGRRIKEQVYEHDHSLRETHFPIPPPQGGKS